MSDLLKETLRTVGDELLESVKRIAENAALPASIREKAPGWAAATAEQFLKAGAAKAAGDDQAFEAATREIALYGEAAKAVGIGQVMLGLSAAEAEARARLSQAMDLGISIGMKLLVAVL